MSEDRLDRRTVEDVIRQDRYTPRELAAVTGISVDLINIEIHKGLLPAVVVDHDIIDIARADAIDWLRRRQGDDAR